MVDDNLESPEVNFDERESRSCIISIVSDTCQTVLPSPRWSSSLILPTSLTSSLEGSCVMETQTDQVQVGISNEWPELKTNDTPEPPEVKVVGNVPKPNHEVRAGLLDMHNCHDISRCAPQYSQLPMDDLPMKYHIAVPYFNHQLFPYNHQLKKLVLCHQEQEIRGMEKYQLYLPQSATGLTYALHAPCTTYEVYISFCLSKATTSKI